MNETLSDGEMRELQAAIATPDGRTAIAQEMMGPFKLGRDYVAIGRQVLSLNA